MKRLTEAQSELTDAFLAEHSIRVSTAQLEKDLARRTSLVSEELMREAEERLEALLLEGLSGDEIKLTCKDFVEIRAEALAQVQKKKK
jgi:hypothetical protein